MNPFKCEKCGRWFPAAKLVYGQAGEHLCAECKKIKDEEYLDYLEGRIPDPRY